VKNLEKPWCVEVSGLPDKGALRTGLARDRGKLVLDGDLSQRAPGGLCFSRLFRASHTKSLEQPIVGAINYGEVPELHRETGYVSDGLLFRLRCGHTGRSGPIKVEAGLGASSGPKPVNGR
jgi:hypothetical protein